MENFEETTETVSGTVAGVVYARESTGYAVLRLDSSDGASITLVGCIPKPVPGEAVTARGRWVTHPSFGRQFEVVSGGCERTMPADKAALFSYLKSGAIPGIGMATAKALLDKFGTAVLEVIEAQPKRLTEVRGITPKRAEAICRAFKEQNLVRRLIEQLTSYKLSPHYALTLFKLYGPDAAAVLAADPYLLSRPPFGADFPTVDLMALSSGIQPDAPIRRRAAVLSELTFNLDNGHAYIPYPKLMAVSAQMLDLPGPELGEAIDLLVEDGSVIREQIARDDACYLAGLHAAECNAADRIRLMSATPPGTPPGIDGLLEQVERDLGLTLEAMQRRAVIAAVSARLFVLTGGPGTGKTTTVRAIADLLKLMDCKVELSAPTGRAAKRLGDVCRAGARTVHRLLGVAPGEDTGELGFSYNAEHPLSCDAVIVDEASMLDIQLTDALLSALDSGTRLILVGDRDQLPAIGPGNVLSELLDCGRVETVTLHEIFRQAAQSRIVTGAHEVNKGRVPELTNRGDLFWMSRPQPAQALETIVELCARRLPENMGVPAASIQVLSPTRRGACGTHSLNQALQEALNPPQPSKREHSRGHTLFREGDRVMQIRNNYDLQWRLTDDAGQVSEHGLGVFNGDIGRVLSIERQSELLTVRFDDARTAVYSFEQLVELELAYAMTVHKSQGSEYQAVVLALPACARSLMNRAILYTAMTRARDLLVLVGDRQVLEYMASNGRVTSRFSGLKARLETTD